MKLLVLATILALSVVVMTAAQAKPAPVVYVGHDKVTATIAAPGALASGPDYAISIARRTGPGQVEIHDKETDTFYVLDGEATFITGGTMIGGRVSRQDQQVGTSIEGGETHQLTKGDVIAIPAGVPHWFKEVPKPFTYYMVKSIRP